MPRFWNTYVKAPKQRHIFTEFSAVMSNWYGANRHNACEQSHFINVYITYK